MVSATKLLFLLPIVMLAACTSAPQVRYVPSPPVAIPLPESRPVSQVRALLDGFNHEQFQRACLANIVGLEGYAVELENLIKKHNEGGVKTAP